MTDIHHPYYIAENGFGKNTMRTLKTIKMSSFQYYDELLMRNWFTSDGDITDLLMQADDATYEKIYNSRDKYSERVRFLIEPADSTRNVKTNFKMRDLTEKDMERLVEEQKQKNEKHFEAEWEKYKETLERPEDSVDHDADEAWRYLDILKNALETHLKTRGIKYVPPSMRSSGLVMDPKQKQLEEKIAEIENEFKKRMEAVEQEDKIWLEFKKNEFRKKMYQL